MGYPMSWNCSGVSHADLPGNPLSLSRASGIFWTYFEQHILWFIKPAGSKQFCTHTHDTYTQNNLYEFLIYIYIYSILHIYIYICFSSCVWWPELLGEAIYVYKGWSPSPGDELVASPGDSSAATVGRTSAIVGASWVWWTPCLFGGRGRSPTEVWGGFEHTRL